MPPLALPGSDILSWLYQKNVPLTAIRAVVTQTDIKKRKKRFTDGNKCRDVVVLWDIHADVSGPYLAMNGEQFPPRTAIIGMEKGSQHGNNGKIGINSDLWARAESGGEGVKEKVGAIYPSGNGMSQKTRREGYADIGADGDYIHMYIVQSTYTVNPQVL